MKFISSDTNVWLDFSVIDKLTWPFLLPYQYIMNNDAVENELLSPIGLKKNLLDLGLQPVELTEEEFYLTESFGEKYSRLSLYDCVALAIAKNRKIKLMTGDGALRMAARTEGVPFIGTIGILDELYNGGYIKKDDYVNGLELLKNNNGKKVRLPNEELQRRIEHP